MLCFISDDPVAPTSSVTQHSLDSTNVSVGIIIGVSFCGVLLLFFAILVITVSIIVFIIIWRKKKNHKQ